MSRREFPDWLTAFVEYAKFSETPEKFLFWSGVCAIAGALERRCWFDQGRYKLYPNFYIVFVAEAGRLQKSTTINVALELLKKVKGVNIAPKSCTWEGFVKLLTSMHRAENEFALDTPNTAVAPVVVAASELSVFFDPDNKGLVSSLVDLWDCPDVFDRFTKMYGMETVEQPCVNIVAGTTPSWIRESFDRWSKEGGFASRTIFLYESQKRQLVAFPKRTQPANIDVLKERLVRDLNYLTSLKGEFTLTEEGYEFGEAWYREHHVKLATLDDVTGFVDRKQAHILKLAMVLSASRRDTMVITLDDLRDATNHIDAVEGDFGLVFGVVDERAELRPYNDIRRFIQRAVSVEWSKLVAQFAGRYMLHEIERAVSLMRNADEIEKTQSGTRIILTYKGNGNAAR